MNKFKTYEVIGDGTYGTVYKGLNIETGEQVAIKKLKMKLKTWQECMELKEVKALSKLKNHTNIIKLKEVVRESNSDVFLIFEYADCNLYQYMEAAKKKGENIPEFKIREFIKQITNGLAHTHSNGYFHRDLKPENILLTTDETVKLADFGLAKELPYYGVSNLTDYVCTRWYRAPECILRSTSYTSSIDIWSLGAIMVELYNLKPLFPGQSELDQLFKVIDILGSPKFNDWPEGYKLINKKNIKFPNSSRIISLSSAIPDASPEAINLLTEMFNWDPMKRPVCGKILLHPFFESGNKIYSYNDTKYMAQKYENSYPVINDYMNNFNYMTYKNNNNTIPTLLNTYKHENAFPNPYLGGKYISQKSKLSNFVENNMRSNNYGTSMNSLDNMVNKKLFKFENNTIFSKNGFFDSYPYLQIYK
jgi:protein kinase